jgi:peptidoglycan/LPS O-acetylase OafA/YrhL
VSRTTAEQRPASPAGRPRFPHIDALRAVAALSVLVFHVHQEGPHYALAVGGTGTLADKVLTQMSNGVCVFFVISGFVLYRPFAAARAGQARPTALRDYLRRRALRILPAYWLALTVLTIAFSLPGVFSHDWWRYYGLLQVYSAHTIGGGMGVAWTLCVEVTFYLALPLIAALAGRVAWGHGQASADPEAPGSAGAPTDRSVRPGTARELALLGGLAALTWGWRLLVTHHVLAGNLLYTLPGTFDWFALGMALAVLSVHGVKVPRRALLAACAVTLPAIVLLPRALPNHLAAGAFAVSLVSLATLAPNPPRVLLWRPLAWLGLISYGIYLWHATLIPPVIHHIHFANFFTVTLGTAALAVAAAALSWYLLERRVLDWGERWARGRRRGGASPAAAAGPAAAAAAPAAAKS